MGGIFGRADAIFGSIECQKAGALHLHAQVFVQCIHQHRPLQEVFDGHADTAKLTQDYLRYKAHVCRQVYEDLEQWKREELATEEAWPEYADYTSITPRPAYQRRLPPARDATRPAGGGGGATMSNRRRNDGHRTTVGTCSSSSN
jgi:hypothetical protein